MKTYATILEAQDMLWLKKQIDSAKVCARKGRRKNAKVIFVSPQNIRLIPNDAQMVVVPIPDGVKLTNSEMNDVRFALYIKRVGAVMVMERNLAVRTLERLFPRCERPVSTVA